MKVKGFAIEYQYESVAEVSFRGCSRNFGSVRSSVWQAGETVIRIREICTRDFLSIFLSAVHIHTRRPNLDTIAITWCLLASSFRQHTRTGDIV